MAEAYVEPTPTAESDPAIEGNVPFASIGSEDGTVPTCKCGAERHPVDFEICRRGHAMPGNRRTVKTGEYSERVDGEEAPVDDWSEMWPEYRRMLHAHIKEMSRGIRERPGRMRSVRHVRTLIDLIRQATELDTQLATADPPRRPRKSDAELIEVIANGFRANPELFAPFLDLMWDEHPDALEALLARSVEAQKRLSAIY